jgi:hypothetical protein
VSVFARLQTRVGAHLEDVTALGLGLTPAHSIVSIPQPPAPGTGAPGPTSDRQGGGADTRRATHRSSTFLVQNPLAQRRRWNAEGTSSGPSAVVETDSVAGGSAAEGGVDFMSPLASARRPSKATVPFGVNNKARREEAVEVRGGAEEAGGGGRGSVEPTEQGIGNPLFRAHDSGKRTTNPLHAAHAPGALSAARSLSRGRAGRPAQ